ncbi:MAG: ATP-binding cassette domain-containing protein [Luteibaculaceae bacterium]
MSEEILKALMQLFAIISKQDDGTSLEERDYVQRFLKQQVSAENVEQYLNLFDDFAGLNITAEPDAPNEEEDGKKKKRALTSVRDSVKTLGICKKINKTLTQQQKVIVLVRLYEMLKAANNFTEQRLAIIFTAGEVFNIDKAEISGIENFILAESEKEIAYDKILLISHEKPLDYVGQFLQSEYLDGFFVILNVPDAGLMFLRYKGHDPVYLNGLSVNSKRVYLFASGSTIKVAKSKPIYYSDVLSNYMSEKDITPISFVVENLQYQFPTGGIGLRNVNLYEEQGHLIGIMGASGAGKTTLLNVMAGLLKPSSGSIRVNGIDITKNPDKVEGVFGYIPQDDLLIEDLTVFENLFYNASLCFKEKSKEELTEMVNKTLKDLGLLQTSNLRVGSPMNKTISGGQRKRLNIALELIREPSILFVDEPTSGLSSRDSENVMDLLRELALKGKLIFVVIHQPSSDIYKLFDKMVFMDVGGYLIYYGNPVEAVSYFKTLDQQANAEQGECPTCGNVNPELVFNIIEARVVDEYGKPTDNRKVEPPRWANFFAEHKENDSIKAERNEEPPKSIHRPGLLKQFAVFFQRDLFSKLANKQYVLINLLEAPVLAIFLSFIIRQVRNPNNPVYLFRENDNISAYLFILVLLALFIGLTVSAEEIFRDRKILKRESFLNLSRFSYLVSKVAILFALSAVQMLLIVAIGNLILDVKWMFGPYWLMLFSVACFSNMLGLNISSAFNSAVTIYILIPLLIIPQMVLGGALFSFENLNRTIGGGVGNRVPWVAEIMPTRWGYEGLAVHQFTHNKFEKPLFTLRQLESTCDYKLSYYIPKLEDKLTVIRMYLINGKPTENLPEVENALQLLKNEIARESTQIKTLEGSWLSDVSADLLDQSVISAVSEILEDIKDYYTKAYGAVQAKKEAEIAALQSTPEGVELYRKMFNNYYNEYLADIVRKRFNQDKIFEYNNTLIQVVDPIYKNPEPANNLDFAAHFFAPKKHFFGKLYPTLYFNIVVIWVLTFFLFITLYYDILRKIVDGNFLGKPKH